MKFIHLSLLLSIASTLCAQIPLSDFDKSAVKYKKINSYIREKQKHNVQYFSQIKPSVSSESDLSAYSFHTATYTINSPLETTWNACVQTSPAQLWNSGILKLGCIYNQNSNTLHYCATQEFFPLDVNQIYFINLRFLRVLNIAAALITTRIDPENKIIEFTYIEGNTSQGKQSMRLVQSGENETKIIHDTYFKSSSKFRDKRLYPTFHQKSIGDLHKNIDFFSTEIQKKNNVSIN
ncbi:MAG: hypothetical protein LBU90_02110 [Bacteroidales bacterium]|jgi:hypothetical protein|nr:hypothetical protein [Bacteroidales bacterium]